MRIPAKLRRNLVVTLCAVAMLLAACDGPESPQSKAEYAALQTAEQQGRGTPLKEPTLREVHGRLVLGVPSAAEGNVWVLLRAEAEPFYKQAPADVYYTVPEELVRQLERDGRVAPEVARWLRKGGV